MERQTQKAKILLTTSTFPRWEQDTEPRFILDLAKSLLPYFDVTVLAPSAPGAKKLEILEGVHVIRYRYFPVRKWETLCYPGAILPRIKEKKQRAILIPFLFGCLWFKLLRIQKDYDIVHANWMIPQGIIQGMFRKPFVVTGHGSDVTALNWGVILSLKRRCLRRAAAVTVVSKDLKRKIESLSQTNDLQVISMGCNVQGFGPENRTDNYFSQGNKKAILFVGRLAEIKGVCYLIDAMKQIPNANLYIVGSGPLEMQLEEQAETLSGRVIFMGAKSHEDLKSIYASADVLAVPSVTLANGGAEGLGLVILEAMASGLPVVGTETGGIPDLIQDRKNGMLVPERSPEALASAICRLLESDDLRTRCRINGQKTAEEYSYERIGAKYAKIIMRALSKKNDGK